MKIIKIPLIIVIIVLFVGVYLCIDKSIADKKKVLQAHINIEKHIKEHYNTYVKTNKETDLYKLKNDTYIKVGKINKDVELVLEKQTIKYSNLYFKIISLNSEYYIFYQDVTKIDNMSEVNDRFKKYIPYNKNVVTKEKITLYDKNNKEIFTIPEELDAPIIVDKDNFYGIEYKNKLVFIKNNDIKEIKENNNTDKKNTSGIAVLNYHFFFDASNPNDSCNQGICLSTQLLKNHLSYIKNNDIFTPSMKELEMYIDGYIQLPKSVVLTIDDGWRAGIGSKIIAEYKLNATIFLMSKYYDPRNYQNEYIEVHSHGHDIHNPGVCPGGQGGAIKCLEKSKLLEDLKSSKEKLNNTTYFCYPFYEYNDYSIEVLKEAGYTMAFGGQNEGGYTKVYPGINKYKIPRYVIMNYTTANDVASYIG